MSNTSQDFKPLKGISSMATKAVLAELAALYERSTGQKVEIESIGGVDAAKRVQAGEAFDVVLLGAEAIDKLLTSGHLLAGSRCDWVASNVAACVLAGSARPDLSSEASFQQVVLAAPSLGYSTGPSGVALAKLFERWGIAQQIAARIIIPPPGVAVASLVAEEKIALGFQQLSEMIHVPGIDIIRLPPATQITTIFSSAISTRCEQREQAQRFLEFLASASAHEAITKHGMTPINGV